MLEYPPICRGGSGSTSRVCLKVSLSVSVSRVLVYYEWYDRIIDAIQREKNIKHWKRAWKIELIEKINSNWDDLYDTLNR